ncbi:MAG: hypothetical protein LBN40_03190 [Oscillospiraceae bacterium]|jgi:hypothetical protein|nr:hypothetical protein [Oscillospiraceae bacterium]
MKRILFFITTAAVGVAAVFSSHADAIDGSVLRVFDGEFSLGAGEEITLGYDNTMILIPGDEPQSGKPLSAIRQNGELWHAVTKIQLKCIINPLANDGDISATYIQAVMQFGEDTGWAFADSSNQSEYVSITPPSSEGFKAGTEYTITYYPQPFMDANGANDKGAGGADWFGLKIINTGGKQNDYRVSFTDLVICGGETTIRRYMNVANDITIDLVPPQFENDPDYDGEGELDPIDKTPYNPNTGYGIAHKLGVMLVSAGVLLISRQRRKRK